jgi:hypothetical protein
MNLTDKTGSTAKHGGEIGRFIPALSSLLAISQVAHGDAIAEDSGSLRAGVSHAFNGAYTVRAGMVVTGSLFGAEVVVGATCSILQEPMPRSLLSQ